MTPLGIASDGYLSPRSPLSIASSGYVAQKASSSNVGGGGVPGWVDWQYEEKQKQEQRREKQREISRAFIRGSVSLRIESASTLTATAQLYGAKASRYRSSSSLIGHGVIPATRRRSILESEATVWVINDVEEQRLIRSIFFPI